jgi:hypothetical protein
MQMTSSQRCFGQFLIMRLPSLHCIAPGSPSARAGPGSKKQPSVKDEPRRGTTLELCGIVSPTTRFCGCDTDSSIRSLS